MKRALFVAIPLMVALASIVTVSTAMLSFPAGAQQALEAYLRYVEADGLPDQRQTLQPELIVRASRPWELNPGLGYPVFGDTWYFHTDRHLSDPTRPPATPFWRKHFPYSAETDPLDDQSALPFPPQEVWCVLLEGQPGERVVFVARHHREPYYTEWVTHQGPVAPFSQAFLETLSVVGCNLGITP
jgi:hypothetical protein